MIKLIIYDLDGTLIDSSKDISNSVNWMLSQLHLPNLSEAKIRSHVGSGVAQLIANVLKEVSQPVEDIILDRAVGLYKTYYSNHLLDETTLYPGVKSALHRFKDKKQAIVTNKTEAFSRRILKGLGIEPYFFEVIGGDQEFPKKPAPDSVLRLVRSSGVHSGETVLIGDSPIDVQTGKNAKVKTIAVTYGFNNRSELEPLKPDLIVDRLDDIVLSF